MQSHIMGRINSGVDGWQCSESDTVIVHFQMRRFHAISSEIELDYEIPCNELDAERMIKNIRRGRYGNDVIKKFVYLSIVCQMSLCRLQVIRKQSARIIMTIVPARIVCCFSSFPCLSIILVSSPGKKVQEQF